MDRGLLIPTYSGRLTRTGILMPSDSTSVTASIWLMHPGVYSLNEWQVEVEVLETAEKGPSSEGTADSQIDQRVRHRYVQGPSEGACVTVVHYV